MLSLCPGIRLALPLSLSAAPTDKCVRGSCAIVTIQYHILRFRHAQSYCNHISRFFSYLCLGIGIYTYHTINTQNKFQLGRKMPLKRSSARTWFFSRASRHGTPITRPVSGLKSGVLEGRRDLGGLIKNDWEAGRVHGCSFEWCIL